MVISFQFKQLQWFLCPSLAPKHTMQRISKKNPQQQVAADYLGKKK